MHHSTRNHLNEDYIASLMKSEYGKNVCVGVCVGVWVCVCCSFAAMYPEWDSPLPGIPFYTFYVQAPEKSLIPCCF